jgi:hypothetical protein
MPAANPMMTFPPPKGDCQMGLVCDEWTATGAMIQIASCIRPCTMDSDCVAPNTLCRPLVGHNKACVASEAANGSNCNRSRRNASPMAGCAIGSACIGGTIRDPQGNRIDDQGSCGVECGTGMAACPAPYTFCNPVFGVTGTVSSGICSERQRGSGDSCDQIDITRQCDSTRDGAMNYNLCVGSVDALPNQGVCLEFCPLGSMPTLCSGVLMNPRAVCKNALQDPTNFPGIGVCSDECSRFPNDCAGMGIGNGQECSGGFHFGTSSIAATQCYDVQAPVLMQWNNPPMSPPKCGTMQGDQLKCPSGTFCAETVTPGADPVTRGCVRGCNKPAAGPSMGCTGTATTCDPGLVSDMTHPTWGICRQ